ncbi:hypothetical protein [Pedobacter cryoconitis]|uniref:Transmembrane protein n=1 Tax=Pedobacter cryoconitis TaxID=188932 RepID=A0A7X0J1N4_9SPHI|nr:hypothetical protein [Pedobacter cryoconitis]MBB6499193.1 hypothetical protein [Pedobacter cryoconitis]
MKRGLPLFWKLYMLFFAIPFPMILYYGINSEYDITGLKDKDPWFVMSVLLVSIVLWLFLLCHYFNSWVLFNFIAKRNIERLKNGGIRRQAKILNAVELSGHGAKYPIYELSLSFKNLVDTEIRQKAMVNDAKPYECRFEAGKRVDLLIDQEMKAIPYFIFASTEVKLNIKHLILVVVGWLGIAVLITGYYIYAYQSESFGMGWRFMSFAHPLIVCPGVLTLYIIMAKYILGKIGQSPGDAALIKFKGIGTTAKILNASQTGMFINEQPQIRFELEYVDHRQLTHRKIYKKVVDLLDLDMVKKESVDIFYLKEDPERIAFTSDLAELS